MSAALQGLLEYMRQHPGFEDLKKAVPLPEPKRFAPKGEGLNEQMADWIHRSGRRQQHDLWLSFLTEGNPARGQTSQQENP